MPVAPLHLPSPRLPPPSTAHTALASRHSDLLAASTQAAGPGSFPMALTITSTTLGLGGLGGQPFDPLTALGGGAGVGAGAGGGIAGGQAPASQEELSRDAAAVLSSAFLAQSQSLTRKIAAMTYDSESDSSDDEGGEARGGGLGAGPGGGGDGDSASELQAMFQRLLYQASAMQIAYQRQILRQTAARDAARSEAAQLRALALSLQHEPAWGGGGGSGGSGGGGGGGGNQHDTNGTAHLINDFNAAAAAAAAIGQVFQPRPLSLI